MIRIWVPPRQNSKTRDHGTYLKPPFAILLTPLNHALEPPIKTPVSGVLWELRPYRFGTLNGCPNPSRHHLFFHSTTNWPSQLYAGIDGGQYNDTKVDFLGPKPI